MNAIPAARAAGLVTVLACFALAPSAGASAVNLAQTRHAPNINAGTVDGSIQQMLPEGLTVNGGGVITGDLLLPGTPAVRLNGHPSYGGTLDGSGSALPSNYQVTLNGSAAVRHVIRRIDPLDLPIVSAPPFPTGTRTVTIGAPGQSAGDFATLRNLTLNGDVGLYAVPPGTYGDFTANGGSGFTLGVAGSTTPAVYQLQHLTLNGQAQIRIVGPVILNLAYGVAANGVVGAPGNPAWLRLNVYSGGVTLNGGCVIHGFVGAPNGTVIINGASQLIGGVACDRLTVNGGGLLRLTELEQPNQPPVANDQAVSLNEDASVPVTLEATDADGDGLAYTVVAPPAHGTLTGAAPNLTYTPAPNYNGPDQFTFTANDGMADSNTATLSITVKPVNDAPIADPKAVECPEDASAPIALSGSDVDGDALLFSVAAQPAHGTLSGSGASLVYTPDANYNGPDEFTCLASDGSLSSSPATVTITVLAQNDAPTAQSQDLGINEGSVLPVTLTGSDIDGDALTFIVETQPAHGTLTGTAPNLSYQPEANFNGTDSFTFVASDGQALSAIQTITVTVTNLNDPPVAQSQAVGLDEDTQVALILVGSDPDGDPITFIIVAPPSHGSLSGTGANLTYTPEADYCGADSFTFKTRDAEFDSAIATVAITVNPKNDAPVVHAQSVSTDEDTPTPITLTGTDVDGDTLAYGVVTQPAHGTLSGAGAQLTYTPATNYNGADSFTFKANDGQVDSAAATMDITVKPVNDAPTAAGQSLETSEDTPLALVLGGADIEGSTLVFTVVAPPAHGTLSGEAPNLVYTPAVNYNGPDSLTFRVNDGALDSEPAEVAVTVTPVNDAPVAEDQTVMIDEDGTTTLTLAGTDPESDPLTYTVVAQPAHGTLTGTAPNFTYTPAANFSGEDSFTYTVSDGTLESSVATVRITVNEVNDPPVANPASVETAEDTPVAITLSGSDPEGSPLGYLVTTPPAHGTLTGTAPAFVYTPATDYNGPDSFAFAATDGQLESAAALVSINVTPVDDAPTAEPCAVATTEDTPVAVTLAGRDPEGAALTYRVTTPPVHGELSGEAPALVYTPEADYNGTDSFAFRVNDGQADSADAVVAIAIAPANDAPSAQDVSAATEANTPVAVTLAGSDPDGDAIAFSVITPPAHGTLSGTAPALTYTPAAGYFGADTFTFQVSDGQLVSGAATATIAIAPPPLTVNAGADQGIGLPAYANLAGSVTYGGTGTLALQWSQVDGPAPVTFETPLAASTRVEFAAPGSYTLRLSATDGTLSDADDVVVTVSASTLAFRTYTTSADFAEGVGNNVNTSVPDQLQLNEQPAPGHFIWVANSSKGTVVKINTRTGRIEGEYWTSPAGLARNPSRTTVDLRGAVWCSNRDGNSVVQIGSVESGMWIDRNGNGQPDTSTGLNDTRAWTNAGGADTNGGVSTAQDECIVNFVKVHSTGTRHLSVDKNNNIWVSGNGTRAFDLIDSRTGSILRTEPGVGHGGYGGLIDRHGVIWSTDWGALMRWDTALPLSGPAGRNWSLLAGSGHYGLAMDVDGYIWASNYSNNVIYKYASTGALVGTYPFTNGGGNKGIATDSLRHVWLAAEAAGRVLHFRADGLFLGGIALGAAPTGVAVDGDGKVWATTHEGYVFRIDPLGGPAGADGTTPVGAIEFKSVNLGGDLYNYSDMTGANLTAPPLSGVWTATFDSGKAGTAWGTINWHAQICDDSKLTFTVCSSADGTTFSQWRAGVRGQNLDVPAGRYLKVNILMQRSTTGQSPVVYDVTVGEQGYQPDYPFNQAPAIEAPALQAANYGIEAKLQGHVYDDGLPYPTTLSYRWEKVSGPGAVTFDDATRTDATATFSLTGSYVLRLTATDGALSTTTDVNVVANTPPTANAGPDLGVHRAGDSIALQGSVYDDGANNGGLAIAWTQVAGPAAATLADRTSPTTVATFPAVGRYVLELSASDGWAVSRDTMQVSAGTSAAADLPLDMSAYWPFDFNTVDVVNGAVARLIGNATLADGYVARGLEFEGTWDSAEVQTPVDLGAASAGLTIDFWAKPGRLQDSALVHWGNASANGLCIWQYGSGTGLYVWFKDTAGTDHTIGVSGFFTANTWVHAVVTYDRATGTACLYRNGKLFLTQAIGIFTPQTTLPLNFGASPRDGAYFKGTLDEIAFYPRPLSFVEVLAIYNAGAGGRVLQGTNAPPVVDAGPDTGIFEASGIVRLRGSVIDDGQPAGVDLFTEWTQLSGPAVAAIGDLLSPDTTVTLAAPGFYSFRLTADDGLAERSDDVGVRVGMPAGLPAPDGLMAWWPGNGTTEDVVSGNLGTADGLGFGAGKVGDAFSVAANGMMLVPAQPGTNVAAQTEGFTIEFWMNASASITDGNERRLLAWMRGQSEQLRISRSSSNDNLRLTDNSGRVLDLGVGAEGQWVHVACTYDKATKRLNGYVNGVLRSSVDASAYVFATNGDLSVGGSFGRPSYELFSGLIDEVAFYSRPLGAGEIAQIYSAGEAGKAPLGPNQAPVVDAGPDTGIAGASGMVTLHGSAADDGLPAGAGLQIEWQQVSGPPTAVIGSPSAPETTISFTEAGIYGFELSADDGFARSSDVVQVRVGMSADAPLPGGLMAWWPGNRTTEDAVSGIFGVARDLGYSTGKVGDAFSVAANGMMLVPARPGTNVAAPADGFTIEFWMNASASVTDGNDRRLLAWTAPDGSEQLRISRSSSNDNLRLTDNSGRVLDLGTGGEGQWVHVAYTYDKATKRLNGYVNGVIRGSVDASAYVIATSGDLSVGNSPSRASYEWFSGQLDEVAFYSRPLGAGEIAQIYNAGSVGKALLGPNQAPVVDAGPDTGIAAAGGAVTLHGTVADDGLPAGAALRSEWKQVFGPAAATIESPLATETAVAFTAPGIYGFELSADDGLARRSDNLEVRVGMSADAPLPGGLMAWWPGNETTEDVVSGIFGNARGLSYATGKVGDAFSVAANGMMLVPARPGTNVAARADGFTIEFWMNASASVTDGNDRRLLAWTAPDGSEQLRISRSSSNDNLRLTDNSGRVLDLGTGGEGQWVHVAYTYDKATKRLNGYINGVIRGSVDAAAYVIATSGDLSVGNSPSRASYEWFSGQLDEVAFYSRPLGAGEIAQIYNAGSVGKALLGPNQAPVVDAGPDTAIAGPSGMVTLHGSVADDGLPAGAALRSEWKQVFGPATATIESPLATDTAVAFTAPGIYGFELGADDGLARRCDNLEVRVGLATAMPPAAGLMAWWPGNRTTEDVVSGIFGVARSLGYATGKVGDAFSVAANGMMLVPARPGTNVAAQADGFTIEFWMNASASVTDGNERRLLAWTAPEGSEQLRISRSSSNDNLRLTDNSGRVLDLGVGAEGQWVHVAYTYDRTAKRLLGYTNGVLRSNVDASAFVFVTNGYLSVGNSPSRSGNEWFNGQLDEISFYGRALTATEVAAIYATGADGKIPIVHNRAPQVSASASGSPNSAGAPATLTATAIDDGLPNPPASLSYAWSQVSGPGTASFAAPSAASTAATFPAAGTYVLRVDVTDSELTNHAEVTVVVAPPPPVPPGVSITSPTTGSSVIAGMSFQVLARATDPDGTVAKVEFFRTTDGTTTRLGEQTAPAGGDPAVYVWTVAGGVPLGTHTFTATATDASGLSTTSDPVVVSGIADPGTGPTVQLATPDADARISAPTPVTGVVMSPLLASWTLESRMKVAAGETPAAWTTVATGTASVGMTGTPGPLGTFDPTLLLNGIYELQLRASDTAGRSVAAGPMTLIVEGNMKVGAFALAFEDLSVPTPGVPIQVVRTYDSRDSRMGDFGPGWRLAVNGVRVQKNSAFAYGWQQGTTGVAMGTVYYIDPTRKHMITVAFPDGETHRFEAGIYVARSGQPLPDNYQWLVPITQGQLRFYPVGDTTSTLVPDGDNTVNFTEFLGEQYLTQDEPGFGAAYEPTRFRLTLKDGTVYVIDERLGLVEMHDLNGNTLVLNRDPANRVASIVSTQNAAGGPIVRTVTIHRDATGRVDYIRDPADRDLDYLYDPQGRLSSFTNRELNSTQFFYENPSFPYYLTKIIDPRGVTALRSEFDDSGRLVKQIDADGKETIFSRGIDATGRFEKIKDRLGNETTYYYDDRGNITAKIDPLGAQTTYAYYADSDRVKFETDHYGNVKSFAYDAKGNVTVETVGASASEDPANPATGYTTRTIYNDRSAPTQITDPDGRVQKFTYDPATGTLLTHTVGFGGSQPSTSTYIYYADGSPETTTDAAGNVTGYAYDYAFSSPSYPSAVKQVTITITDPAGAPGSDPSNAADTVLRSTRSLTDAQENQIAQITTRTLAAGGTEDVVTRYVYDSENRLVATIQPDGMVSETRYNAFGKPSATLLWKTVADFQGQADSNARVTGYDYDDRGNETTITYPDATTEVSHYDAENRRDWSQDRLGRTTSYQYDAVGRLRFTIHPGGASTETVYDLVGRVTDTYDELRSHTRIVYFAEGTPDAMRRKQTVAVRAAGDLVTAYQYDHAGNVRYVTDPRGNTVETQYDDQGRPRFVIYPATDEHPSTQSETQYNLLGQRVAAIDQEGKVTRYRYDGLGRLIEVRQYIDASAAALDSDGTLPTLDARLASTRYTYDELGAQTTQTDALGRVTTYHTDASGRRTERILPDNATESLQYDEWGNLWKRTDFVGKTTVFTYDALNRLKTKTADPTHPSLNYGHAIARVEYDYDANGARTAARTYNNDNTLLYTESTPRTERGWLDYKDAGGTRLDYSNDDNGLLKDVVSSTANGANLGYRYDELNRLAYVDDATTGTVRTTSYTYNPNGSLESVTAPNGVTHTYAYDTLNRLRTLSVTLNLTTLHSYTYGLYPSGHRHQVLEGPAPSGPARTTTYAYDGLYRLTDETIADDPSGQNGTVTYGLDKVGNRLSRTVTGGLAPQLPPQASTYNARDWLDSDTYDANGNTVSALDPRPSSLGSVSDTYDFENRLLLRTRADGTQVNIAYDADGIRIQKTILDAGGGLLRTTGYLVDTNNLTGYAQVLEETTTDASGTTLKVYAYGSDLISQTSGDARYPLPTTRYYGYDGHGSVRELTDDSGAVTDTYTYDAFGVLLARIGTSDNAYLYCGEQSDDDLGMYFLRARYLNPISGRFWTMDEYQGAPGDPATLHKYRYANGNPIVGRDPNGTESLMQLELGMTQQALLQRMAVRRVSIVFTAIVNLIMLQMIVQTVSGPEIGTRKRELIKQELQSEGVTEFALIRRRLKANPPIFPDPISVWHEVAEHDELGQGINPHWVVLHAGPRLAGAREFNELNRGESKRSSNFRPISGRDRHEYPFASTLEGGYWAISAMVDSSLNRSQGNALSAFYALNQMRVGDPFIVQILP